jgi:hypothetical protein
VRIPRFNKLSKTLFIISMYFFTSTTSPSEPLMQREFVNFVSVTVFLCLAAAVTVAFWP